MIAFAPAYGHNPNERKGMIPDMARAGTSEKPVGLGHRVGFISDVPAQLTSKRASLKARGVASQLDRRHYKNRRRPTVRR